MFHTIEFVIDCEIDLEVSPRQPLEKQQIRCGDRRCAQIKPSVIETRQGPTEVADLFFDDGTTTRKVGFWRFRLIE
jgi:hypothetical protein